MRASAQRRAFLASLLMTSAFALPASAQELAPPPPMSNPSSPGGPEGAPGDTQRKLDEAEQKDSGRHFELIWVDGSAGASYINKAQFSAEKLGIEKTDSAGPAFSLGAGVRLVIFVAGVRARYNALSSFGLWQLNGEAGLKIPIGSFDFLLTAHGGYSFTGSVDSALAKDDLAVRGFNAGLDLGLDYYVTPIFSVGAGFIGDFLFLKRPQIDKPPGFAQLSQAEQDQITSSPLYSQAGSSAGLQLGGGLRLGLHFGL